MSIQRIWWKGWRFHKTGAPHDRAFNARFHVCDEQSDGTLAIRSSHRKMSTALSKAPGGSTIIEAKLMPRHNVGGIITLYCRQVVSGFVDDDPSLDGLDDLIATL